MSVLKIRLFGGLELKRHDDTIIPLQPVVQAFLAYLLLNRDRCHRREVLSGLFWGKREESQARRCLSTTLWRLRRDLEPDGTPRGTFVVSTASGDIGFNCQSDSYWMDIAVFEEKASDGLSSPPSDMSPTQAQQLEEAVALVGGDLLEGFYADWVLHHRERLRTKYLNCLGRLMRYHSQRHAFEQSIFYGRKILEFDPLREEIHRSVMRLYSQVGERAQAIQQYERCRQVLAEELAIEPMPETQALNARLVRANGQSADHPPSEGGKGRAENVQQAMRQLDQALLSLDEVREQLHQAMRAVNQLINR